MISIALLAAVCPHCAEPDLHAPGLEAAAEEYEINTPRRVAAWLAQLAHESGEFNRLHENLSYSAERLITVWPGRFKTIEAAKPYARNAEALANLVYANRLGNDRLGDGWKYRGRGYIQLTGKATYAEHGAAIGVDLVGNPDLAAEPATAARLAGSFWQRNGCNEFADDGAFEAICRKVNGGLHGWPSRVEYWKRSKKELGII